MSDPLPQKPNSEQLDEELVAYLDGELESQSSQKLENLLATDAYARQRLNQLAVSWDMLDQLPRASVDDLFTRTTVEMVAVAAEEEITRTSSGLPARKRRRWVAGGVATLLAAAVGFMAIGVLMPDQNDPLLRNLPVVVNLDMYRSVGDVELLKKLEASDMFAADVPEPPRRTAAPTGTLLGAPGAGGPASTSTTLLVVPKTISERRAWIAALSPDKKLELNHDLEKFVALSPDEKQALRGIDEYLLANPDQADQLSHIMQRYHDWLKTLTPAERADLSDSPTSEQHVAEVKKLRQEQEGRMFLRLGAGQGPARAMDPVMRWVQDFAVQHEKEILEALPEDRQQNLKQMALRTSERGGERGGERERGGQWFYQRSLAWELWQPNSPVKMPDITEADVKPLLTQLTSDRQTALQAATDSDQRVQLLRQWIHEAIIAQRAQFGSQGNWRMGGSGNVDRRRNFEDQVKRYEENLSPEEKKRFSSLTDEQKRAEMLEQFRKRRSQSAGRPSGMGFPRPRDDAPHGPPAGKDAPEQSESPPPERPEEMDPAPPPPMP